ncbi:MAG: VOC family protein [Caldilineaceae bacterium]
MTTPLGFDHIIIAVRDLDAAIADYRALGFTTYYGGKHTHKATHNGLIALADGSYLELLAPVDPTQIDGTIGLLAQGEGFAGYALLSTDLAQDRARLQAAGIAVSEIALGHRSRYDGVPVAWEAVNLAGTRSPFLIADVTPHLLRVPDDAEKITHANGAVGIARLTVAVTDLTAATARYRAILDQAPQPKRQEDQMDCVDFPMAGYTLTLARPTDNASPLAEHLARFRETPYELVLRTQQPMQAEQPDLALAHGARIALIGD